MYMTRLITVFACARLQISKVSSPATPLSSLNVSDSSQPVALQVSSNRCWSPNAVLSLSCTVSNAVGQKTDTAPPVAVVVTSPTDVTRQPSVCATAPLEADLFQAR